MATKVKTKTKAAVKKRVKVTATGKLIRAKAYTSHLAQTKTTKQKRHARKTTFVSSANLKRIKALIAH